MSAPVKPQGKAMYVASTLDREWLLSEQRRLHERSRSDPDYVFRKLWGLTTDLRTLRCALARVSGNRGRRTAGVDGITVRKVLAEGVDTFVVDLRAELRSGNYRPSPVRRVLIPKPGQPGKFRPLGIPTVKDRVVQAAMKSLMEPIFEADFYPSSHGFRPARSVHGALEHLRVLLRPRHGRGKTERKLPYQWAIEGDIKGCFDHIDHHSLMVRVRRRIGDAKLNRLVLAFLKAGVIAEAQCVRTDSGTPQGGVLSPLLANIALSELDERYQRYAWPNRTPSLLTDPKGIQKRAEGNRYRDRRAGRAIFVPVRYADDFIILVGAPPGPDENDRAREAALREKAELAEFLRQKLDLELSETKTLVTPVTSTLRFLGHHVRVRNHPDHGRPVCLTVVPKDRSLRLRESIKKLFARPTIILPLADRLKRLNPLLRGWCNFYRHAWGAARVFDRVAYYVWWTIYRWLRKKHPRVTTQEIWTRYALRRQGRRSIEWRDGDIVCFPAQRVRVERFWPGQTPDPYFVTPSMESPVHNERCTPGSERGARKPIR